MSGIQADDMDRMFQGLYKHLKDIKQRVVGKCKIHQRAIDSYLEHYKKNKKKIVPLVEDINWNRENVIPAASVSKNSIYILQCEISNFPV